MTGFVANRTFSAFYNHLWSFKVANDKKENKLHVDGSKWKVKKCNSFRNKTFLICN